jgi:hypothetical protein
MINTPPMPTRFIASRSAVIPLLVIFPFSQNQYTHGRALSGGCTNCFSSAASEDGALPCANGAAQSSSTQIATNALTGSAGILPASTLASRFQKFFDTTTPKAAGRMPALPVMQFGAWNLKRLWSLDVGVWNFSPLLIT